MKTMKKTKKRKFKERIPVPNKASRPMSTKKGKKGYDRRKKHKKAINITIEGKCSYDPFAMWNRW